MIILYVEIWEFYYNYVDLMKASQQRSKESTDSPVISVFRKKMFRKNWINSKYTEILKSLYTDYLNDSSYQADFEVRA